MASSRLPRASTLSWPSASSGLVLAGAFPASSAFPFNFSAGLSAVFSAARAVVARVAPTAARPVESKRRREMIIDMRHSFVSPVLGLAVSSMKKATGPLGFRVFIVVQTGGPGTTSTRFRTGRCRAEGQPLRKTLPVTSTFHGAELWGCRGQKCARSPNEPFPPLFRRRSRGPRKYHGRSFPERPLPRFRGAWLRDTPNRTDSDPEKKCAPRRRRTANCAIYLLPVPCL